MTRDEKLAADFVVRYAEARARLRDDMERAGLRERDGWRIAETTRSGPAGYEIVLRPVHRSLPSPADFECVVRIDGAGDSVRVDCAQD